MSSEVYSQAVVAQPVVSSYVQTVVAQPVFQQVIAQPVVSSCYSQGLIAQPVLGLGMGGYSESVIGSGYGVGVGFQQGLLVGGGRGRFRQGLAVGGGRGRFRSRTVIRQKVRGRSR